MLPFLRKDPAIIKDSFFEKKLQWKHDQPYTRIAILFKFKTLISYFEGDDDSRNDTLDIDLTMRSPNFLYVGDDRWGEAGIRVYCNRSHPNIDEAISFTCNGANYRRACLGDRSKIPVIIKANEVSAEILNIIASRIYHYASSYNHSGYQSAWEADKNSNKRCQFCNRKVKKDFFCSEILYNYKKFICLDCTVKPVSFTDNDAAQKLKLFMSQNSYFRPKLRNVIDTNVCGKINPEFLTMTDGETFVYSGAINEQI